MKKLKFAIIGFGKMGQIRFDALTSLSGCEIVCISDTDSKVVSPKGVPNVRRVENIF